MVFLNSCPNNVEIRYHNVQGGTGRFHRQGNELALWYLSIFTPKLIPWAVQLKIVSTRIVELYMYLECIL